MNTGTVHGDNYGAYNAKNGSMTICNGTVKGGSGIGNGSTGNIILGVKGDGEIYTDTPLVTGKYGIYNTKGNFYFYDGRIEGTTKAVYDIITEIEENTELNYEEDEKILTLSYELVPEAQIGEITYETLQDAINSVSAQNITTIEILKNIVYTSNDNIIIVPSDKNIVLDLKGHKITSAIPEQLIQNQGILEITDTSENSDGEIVTSAETTINNVVNATLKISKGRIYNRTKQSIYNEGKAIVQGGTIEHTSNSNGEYKARYAIYNNGAGMVIINSGTVSCTNVEDRCYAIYNANNGTITVNNGIININSRNISYGIYNNSLGIVNMLGGTIISHSSNSNGSYGVYNVTEGTIIIGNKGDGIVSQTEPLIANCKYGIKNEKGILKYYDGIIKGRENSIYGIVTELEEFTELFISSEIVNNLEYEVIELQIKENNVASANGIEYDSIQKAVQECGTTESTIKILRDADPGATIIIEEGQNIAIDLNGYIVNNYPEIMNKGTLKIIDNSDKQTGKIVGLTETAISNTGMMELSSGSIVDSGYGINNSGTLTINGGTITNNIYGIYNKSNGIITLIDGKITSNTYGIYNYGGISNINGGKISLNEYGIYSSTGTVNIKGAGISNDTYGVYVAGGTTTIKEGSEIQSNTGVYVGNGTLNIGETGTMNSSSPVIIGEEYGLVVSSTATVNMYDGQIKGKTGATQGFITYTESGYAVANKVEGEYFADYLALAGTISTVAQVNGIDFSNLQSAINSIVGEEIQTIKLTNGISTDVTFTINEGQNIILDMNEKTITSSAEVTINNAGNLTIIDSTSTNVGKISNTVGTAIVNSGTLTLGQDDGTVNQELITIEGTTYGIQNSGTLNFYDGTINGASAVSGTITNRAAGYIIRTTTVNGKERYYLSVS